MEALAFLSAYLRRYIWDRPSIFAVDAGQPTNSITFLQCLFELFEAGSYYCPPKQAISDDT